MLRLILFVVAAAAGNIISINDRVSRQTTGYDGAPIWHYTFPNLNSPQLKAIHDGTKLKVCYQVAGENSTFDYYYNCTDTENYFQFVNHHRMTFAQAAHLDGIIYDDSNSTMLSAQGVYPAIIAISQEDAYSSTDDNLSWLKSCEDCIQSNITKSNAEIYKSHDGTFWVSINNNNKIITSKDLRTWISHDLPRTSPPFILHNIFPMKTDIGEDMWILVQITIWYGEKVYHCYMGTITHEDGYGNERGQYNMTYGPDDFELFFANKGDAVQKSQIMLPTFVNTYFGTTRGDVTNANYVALLKAPRILATPRSIMFKNFRGVSHLVQVPAVKTSVIPPTFRYNLANLQIQKGMVNPLSTIRSTSFILNMTFSYESFWGVGIDIRKSSDGQEMTHISHVIDGPYFVDRKRSGVPPAMSTANKNNYQRIYGSAKHPSDSKGGVNFLIYADGPVLEVFCLEGYINFNLLIFPLATSNRMELNTASNKPQLLVNLDFFQYD